MNKYNIELEISERTFQIWNINANDYQEILSLLKVSGMKYWINKVELHKYDHYIEDGFLPCKILNDELAILTANQ